MELLRELYSIHSPSGSERKMKKFVTRYVASIVPDAVITNDGAGNLYIVKGKSETYPCIAAHLDQVQKTHSKDFTVMQCGDRIFGYSPSRGTTEGLGADDKNGIWIALKCLECFDALKVAFFVGEEVGCVGSSRADLSFFKDCRFIIEPDRKGGRDFIQSMSCTRVCSDEFAYDADFQSFGYDLAEGLLTDVLTLVEDGVGISCCNLSCGYYRPHTDEESTSWSELNNALELVKSIITKCTKVYPHEYTFSYGHYGKFDSWYDSSDWKLPNSWKLNDGLGDDENDDDGWNKYRHPFEECKLSDYYSVEDLIECAIYFNPEYAMSEVYDHLRSDLDTVGMTETEFYQIARQWY